ncbi:hypothetical protein PENSPDRAFT_658292 [Peniophora sp. CONT]|nr:hypothetical protein PENSPDRAFT_658292 [Peniophora sp. CONT]
MAPKPTPAKRKAHEKIPETPPDELPPTSARKPPAKKRQATDESGSQKPSFSGVSAQNGRTHKYDTRETNEPNPGRRAGHYRRSGDEVASTARAKKDERDTKAQQKVNAADAKQQRESTAATSAARRQDEIRKKRTAESDKERPPVAGEGKTAPLTEKQKREARRAEVRGNIASERVHLEDSLPEKRGAGSSRSSATSRDATPASRSRALSPTPTKTAQPTTSQPYKGGLASGWDANLPAVNETKSGVTRARTRPSHIRTVRRAPEEIDAVEERGLASEEDEDRVQEEKTAVRKGRGIEMVSFTSTKRVKEEEDAASKEKGGRKSAATSEAVPRDLLPVFADRFLPLYIHRISLLPNPFKPSRNRSDPSPVTLLQEVYDEIVPSNTFIATKSCGLYAKCGKVTEAYRAKFLARARTLIDAEVEALPKHERAAYAHAAMTGAGKANRILWAVPERPGVHASGYLKSKYILYTLGVYIEDTAGSSYDGYELPIGALLLAYTAVICGFRAWSDGTKETFSVASVTTLCDAALGTDGDIANVVTDEGRVQGIIDAAYKYAGVPKPVKREDSADEFNEGEDDFDLRRGGKTFAFSSPIASPKDSPVDIDSLPPSDVDVQSPHSPSFDIEHIDDDGLDHGSSDDAFAHSHDVLGGADYTQDVDMLSPRSSPPLQHASATLPAHLHSEELTAHDVHTSTIVPAPREPIATMHATPAALRYDFTPSQTAPPVPVTRCGIPFGMLKVIRARPTSRI